MQQDEAIIKALKEERFSSLSPDFNERAMLRIYKEAERNKKQKFIYMLSSISAVSLTLIVATAYLLKKYLSFKFAFNLQIPSLKLNSLPQYYFHIYIAVLILFLIFFDYFFRNFWNRRKHQKEMELYNKN